MNYNNNFLNLITSIYLNLMTLLKDYVEWKLSTFHT
jgi:hypothetical protein